MPTGQPQSASTAKEPRIGQHAFVCLLGLGNFVTGIVSLVRDMPGVLVAVLLIAGVLMPVLAWFSYQRSRAAWAFLLTICFVFAVTYTFGAPKIAHGLAIPLGAALIGPALFAFAGVALALLYLDYATADRAPS